ncbi:MAG TPA: C4-type zinc ribbon domain-containing protein [Streptosporangiaceae bacterium]|nr:C4-type zinc ribbon domain-containing protein [Streptosporangiaceae bacterium]
MKASPQIQLRLLELADLDAELARLDHRRRGLPEVAELAARQTRAADLKDALVATETELGDLSREQTRAERDVEQVRTRIDRDRTRLDAGQVSAARELASLQSEIENLHRRQGDLEEVVLELMERRETLESQRDELTTGRDSIGGEMAEVAARRDAAISEIDEQTAKASDQRDSVAAEVPADLLALYDQIRKTKGVGAAVLRAGRCEGCHLSLNAADLNVIRASAPDEVVRCEECRRILVRTPESGI